MSDNEFVTIENGSLAVRIAPKGAEMQSIVCDGIERLWCGDPAVWGRHAPLLFPLIGRLRDSYYELDGRRIDAPTHGFCRDRVFSVERLGDAAVRFTTCDDEETRAVFPFAFRLSVAYALEGSSVVKTHCVENRGDAPLPFEVGGHEAYATRLLPGETMEDYYVRFGAADEGADEADGMWVDCAEMFAMDEGGILDVPKIAVPLEAGCLTKTPEQLGIDTIVLKGVPGSTATLASRKSDRAVTVEFPDFPYLGIWTKPMGAQTRYLCIEPWSALPDAHFSSRELAEKPGVRTVAPGEAVELTYRMTFR